uniref:Uncharacterized protein n=1 Tax=Panagrolaimus davidi TaxID=227884 RepID=A0A914QNM2_9BILA
MSFANPQMRQIKFINMWVARSVAIVANLTLAWLVTKHTKKVLQPYKRILAITIFMDLAVSITVLAFQTVSFVLITVDQFLI